MIERVPIEDLLDVSLPPMVATTRLLEEVVKAYPAPVSISVILGLPPGQPRLANGLRRSVNAIKSTINKTIEPLGWRIIQRPGVGGDSCCWLMSTMLPPESAEP